jgi:alpha-L-glutamate ligase-like protein
MAKSSNILGMNARNLNYLRFNTKKGRDIADSKLLTKKVLRRKKIPHPKLIKTLNSISDIQEFDWLKLGDNFVIKPSEGFGGSGILVVKKACEQEGEWILMNNKKVTVEDLKLHASDIIEGQYSRNRTPDQAFIETRIKIHPKFSKYAYRGTPDVRIIIFNQIPIMAMLRLPTKESDGKANLHQGAIGLGIDLATGITTHGVHHDKVISTIPGKNRKVNGIVVPYWPEILKISIDAQRACGLGYVGVDIVIDEENGPQIIELNDQPGLQIQLANLRGLQERLRRVEDLEVSSQYKGIQIAEVLFAEDFSDKVKAEKGRKIVGVFEKVKIIYDGNKIYEILAKMDTGAYNVSIDKDLAKELGLLKKENVLYETEVESSLGKETRPVIEIEFWIQGRKIKAMAHVANRKHLRSQMLVGRRYLKDFIIDPSRVDEYEKDTVL